MDPKPPTQKKIKERLYFYMMKNTRKVSSTKKTKKDRNVINTPKIFGALGRLKE